MFKAIVVSYVQLWGRKGSTSYESRKFYHFIHIFKVHIVIILIVFIKARIIERLAYI